MSFLNEVENAIPALQRYARAMLRDPVRAEDLVQDCLEKALRKRHLWRPSGAVRSWLFKMMLNLHRDQLRSPQAKARFEAVEDAGLAAHDALAGRVALRETARHMARLPLEQRQVLLLIAVEGFGYAEACKILGIPKGTLMSRLARARAALRAMRDEEPAPHGLRSVK